VYPNFLIIGAQKSATTFVHKCLREHPDVFMPHGETRFFEDPEYLQTNSTQFETLFRNVSKEQAIGIKRPDYLAKPECPPRIHQHLPQAKLLVILRNPVERAISAYFHLMECSFIPIRPAEEGLTRILNGEYQDLYPKSREIIEYGFYYKHLLRYLNYFDQSQMLIMLLNTVKANPLISIQEAYRFIGVNDEFVPASLRMSGSRNRGVYSLTRLRLLTVCNGFMYRYNPDRTKRYAKRPGLWDRAINKLVVWTDRLLLAPICYNTKPELSSTLKKRLNEIYKDDINGLEGLLDQKLRAWKSFLPEPSSEALSQFVLKKGL
jgi:sulfotransferase family protein